MNLDDRRLEVLEENSRSLSRVVRACAPLFDKVFDVVGDDDAAMITLSYDDWTYLLDTMKPFYPKEIRKIERKLFPKATPLIPNPFRSS